MREKLLTKTIKYLNLELRVHDKDPRYQNGLTQTRNYYDYWVDSKKEGWRLPNSQDS